MTHFVEVSEHECALLLDPLNLKKMVNLIGLLGNY